MMKLHRMAAVSFFLLSLSLWAESSIEPKPYLMASLGDSITAASVANTSLAEDWRELAPSDDPADPNRSGGWTNKDTLSWASGLQIPSHVLQLRDYLLKHQRGAQLEILNVAVPGSKAEDLLKQAQEIVEAAKSGKYAAIKYVTFMVGGNDACSDVTPTGTPNDKFRAALKLALAKLAEIRQEEPLRILMVGIPKIPELGRPEIREHKTWFGLRCDQVRNTIMGMCNNMTRWDTWQEYRDGVAAVAAKNEILAEEAFAAPVAHPNLEVSFSNTLWETPLSAEILAMDCFHPNETGHTLLALQLWYDQPWFK